MFGKNQRVKALTATASRTELLLEGAAVAFGFRVFLSRAIGGGIGQADDDPSNGSQNTGGPRMPNPAAVLLESDIQTMVQPALDHPITPL